MHQFYYTNIRARSGSAYESRGFSVRASSTDESAIDEATVSLASYPEGTRDTSLAPDDQPVRFMWTKSRGTGLGQAFHSVYVGDVGDNRAGSFFAHAIWNVPKTAASAREVIRMWRHSSWQRGCGDDVGRRIGEVEDWPWVSEWPFAEACQKLRDPDFRQIAHDCLCLWISPPPNVPRQNLKLFVNLPASRVAALVRILAECVPKRLLEDLTFSTLEDVTDAPARIIGCRNSRGILRDRPPGQNPLVPHEFLVEPHGLEQSIFCGAARDYVNWALGQCETDEASLLRFIVNAEEAETERADEFLALLDLERKELSPELVRRFMKSGPMRRHVMKSPRAIPQILMWFLDQEGDGAGLWDELLSNNAGDVGEALSSLQPDLQKQAIIAAEQYQEGKLKRLLESVAPQLGAQADERLWSNAFSRLEELRTTGARAGRWGAPFSIRLMFLTHRPELIGGDENCLQDWTAVETPEQFQELLALGLPDGMKRSGWMQLVQNVKPNEDWPERVIEFIRRDANLLADSLRFLHEQGCDAEDIASRLEPVLSSFQEWMGLIERLNSLSVDPSDVPYVVNHASRDWKQFRPCLALNWVGKALAHDEMLGRNAVSELLHKRDYEPLRAGPIFRAMRPDNLKRYISDAVLEMVQEGDSRLAQVKSAISVLKKDCLLPFSPDDIFSRIPNDVQASGMLAFWIEEINADDEKFERLLQSFSEKCLADAFARLKSKRRRVFYICWKRDLKPDHYPAPINNSELISFLRTAKSLTNDQSDSISDISQILKLGLPNVTDSCIAIGNELSGWDRKRYSALVDQWLVFMTAPYLRGELRELRPHVRSVLEAQHSLTDGVSEVLRLTLESLLVSSTDSEHLSFIRDLRPLLAEQPDGAIDSLDPYYTLWKFQERPHLDEPKITSVISAIRIWGGRKEEYFVGLIPALQERLLAAPPTLHLQEQCRSLASLINAIYRRSAKTRYTEFATQLLYRSRRCAAGLNPYLFGGLLNAAPECGVNLDDLQASCAPFLTDSRHQRREERSAERVSGSDLGSMRSGTEGSGYLSSDQGLSATERRSTSAANGVFRKKKGFWSGILGVFRKMTGGGP